MINQGTETSEQPEATEGGNELSFTGYGALESMVSERKAARGDVQQEQVAEEVYEDEEAEETEDNISPVEDTTPSALFTLDDGTAITDPEEAKRGYLRHGDYTRKTQEVAKERERIQAIYDYYSQRPEKLKELVDEMAGNKPQPQAAAPQVRPKLDIPDHLKEDPWVKSVTDTLGAVLEKVDKLEGGQKQATQTAEEQRQIEARQRVFFDRVNDGYNYLKGIIGDTLTPQDFESRIQAYLAEQGLNPQAVGANIISDDTLYIRALVDRVFSTDIGVKRQDKVAAEMQKRKPAAATKQVLKSTGKTGKRIASGPPKLQSGRLDRDAHFREHPFIKEQVGS